MHGGAVVMALAGARRDGDGGRPIQMRQSTVITCSLAPRTRAAHVTRAQSMDVLSSQATVAGYQAALIGASKLARFLPMLTTAAGSS